MEILLVETTQPQYSWIEDHLLGLGYEVTTTALDTVVTAFQERMYPLTIFAVASPGCEPSLLCRHLTALPKNDQQIIFVVIELPGSSPASFQSLLDAGVDVWARREDEPAEEAAGQGRELTSDARRVVAERLVELFTQY